MELRQARLLAEACLEIIKPYCTRAEIAGSIRRGKSEVKDIEIVAEPNVPDKADLFYSGPTVTHAVQKILEFHSSPELASGVNKDGERYKQIYLSDGINLDLFLARYSSQWGVLFAIRTGPGEFSNWIVTPRTQRGALPSNCVVKNNSVYCDGKFIPMPEEIDFLNFLGLGWIEPSRREARWGRMPTHA